MGAVSDALRSCKVSAVLGEALLLGLLSSAGKRSWAPAAERLRAALETLGPAFVKLGQFLSVRPDLLSPEFLAELEKLQDATSPLPVSDLLPVVEGELGAPVHRLFVDMEEEPLASASLSQVHRALLPGGETVAVKVQKPGAASSIRRDLALFGRLFTNFVRWSPLRHRLDAPGLWAEVIETSEAELDFRREAEAAEAMRRHFRRWDRIRIPRVHWGLTSRRVLTAEYVRGSKISDPSLRGSERYADLAELGARAFLKQVLTDGLFHADLHPANILITPTAEIAYVDFGIVGRLTAAERTAAIGVLVGLLAADAPLCVRNLEELGIGLPPERRLPFSADLIDLCRRALSSPLGEVSVPALARELFSALRRHRVALPRKYAVLVKSLLTIEGTARGLHPEFRFADAVRQHFFSEDRSGLTLSGMLEAGWRGIALLGLSALCAFEGPRPRSNL